MSNELFLQNVNNAMNFLLYLRTTNKMMCEDRKLNIHYLTDAEKFYITVSLHLVFLLPPQPSLFLIIFSVLVEEHTLPWGVNNNNEESDFHRLAVLNPKQKPRILLG